jgi:hypothetical protein
MNEAELFMKTATEEIVSVPSIIDSRHQTINVVPAAWESFKLALAQVQSKNLGRRITVVSEAFFYGILPMFYGASLPDGVERPRTICISITAPAIRSVDLPPFGFPFPFDPSPSGRERNAALWDKWEERAKPVTELLDRKLIESGASSGAKQVFMAGANYIGHDAILQIGLPGFEYPRSDFPESFKLVGIIPPIIPMGKQQFPWWDDLIANRNLEQLDIMKKKIVVVAQGTVETNPYDLIVPTLRVLARHADIISIAILGARGATLPAEFQIPENARIADYLNYDAALEFADIWIHNGGYGATTHGIAHGVPMIIAGEGQDKPESGRRVAWSGIGLDLQCARPTTDMLSNAVDQILTNNSFATSAAEMKQLAESMDCFGLIESEICSD